MLKKILLCLSTTAKRVLHWTVSQQFRSGALELLSVCKALYKLFIVIMTLSLIIIFNINNTITKQRLSIAVQRGNATYVTGTLSKERVVDDE